MTNDQALMTKLMIEIQFPVGTDGSGHIRAQGNEKTWKFGTHELRLKILRLVRYWLLEFLIFRLMLDIGHSKGVSHSTESSEEPNRKRFIGMTGVLVIFSGTGIGDGYCFNFFEVAAEFDWLTQGSFRRSAVTENNHWAVARTSSMFQKCENRLWIERGTYALKQRGTNTEKRGINAESAEGRLGN